MDWLSDPLSDFGWWLLNSPDWGLLVGAALIWGGIFTLAYLLISRYGDVRMGADPAPPRPSKLLSEATTVIVTASQAAPNYHREDMFPLAVEFVAAVDEAADAVTEVIEVKPTDVLDVTAELKAIDPSVPIFCAIKHPPPGPDLETFTVGWNRKALQERIKEGKP